MTDASADVKTCPACAEEVKAAAVVCRFCGFNFSTGSRSSGDSPGARPVTQAGKSTTPAGAILVSIAGILVIVASFLPWVTLRSGFGTISRSGMEGGDGLVTLLLGIVILLIGVARFGSFTLPAFIQSSAIVAGGAVAIFAVINFIWVQDRVAEANVASQGFAVGSVGAGVWTLFIGAAVAILGGFVLRMEKK